MTVYSLLSLLFACFPCFGAAHVCLINVDPHIMTLREWEEYSAIYGKFYDQAENQTRFSIMKQNKIRIVDHNNDYSKLIVSYSLAYNNVTDLTTDEANSVLNGYQYEPIFYTKNVFGEEMVSNVQPYVRNTFDFTSDNGKEVNWVKSGMVTPVMNQGNCRADYAIAAVGAIESRFKIKYGWFIQLSVQNVIDCIPVPKNLACQRGTMVSVYEMVKNFKGLNSATIYPYNGFAGPCRFNSKYSLAPIESYRSIRKNDINALQKAVDEGPVSAAVDASLMTFHMYSGGIYSDRECNSENVNHGVLIVGYGFDEKIKKHYWLLKNSWGGMWGENGYMRLEKTNDNFCGIATAASYPVLFMF